MNCSTSGGPYCVCTIAFKRSALQECFGRRHDSGPIESRVDTTPRYPSSPACARRSPELTYGPFFGEPQRTGTKFKRGNGKLTCHLMATASTLGMPLWEFHFIFWVASSTPRSYPKYEMEFPQRHSKSAGGGHEVAGQLPITAFELCACSLRLPEKWPISQFRRPSCARWTTRIARRSVYP